MRTHVTPGARPLAVLIGLLSLIPMFEVSAEAPVTLTDAVDRALQSHPAVRAARARAQAARHRIPQASALPDPTVGYTVMGEMLETRLGPQEDMYEIEQMIPFPAKLIARRRVAREEAAIAGAQLSAVEQDVRAQVVETMAALASVDASILTLQEAQRLLRTIEAIAQSRYASQGGSQRDVAKAQTEVSELMQRQFVLRQRRASLAAQLNALQDLEADAPIGAIVLPPAPKLTVTLDELIETARGTRPELQEARAAAARDRHESALARLEYLPDVSVGFQYVQIGRGMTSDPDDGRDAWMVPLRVTVPLWQNRIVPRVREASARARAARAEAEAAANDAEVAVRQGYWRYQAASQQLALSEHALLPQAELAWRADQAGYEADRADILHLVDSQRSHLGAQLARHEQIAEVFASYAALERAVGRELPGGWSR